jgi:hypothetical protein
MAIGWKKTTKVPVAAHRDVVDWYESTRYWEIVQERNANERRVLARRGFYLSPHVSGGAA